MPNAHNLVWDYFTLMQKLWVGSEKVKGCKNMHTKFGKDQWTATANGEEKQRCF